MSNSLENLYNYRFSLFFYSLLCLLFGSVFFKNENVFYNYVFPVFFLFNLLAGINLISKSKLETWLIILLFSFVIFLFGTQFFFERTSKISIRLEAIRLVVYFIFYIIFTIDIIRQLWNIRKVNSRIIYGLMSGYICLGFSCFFIYGIIELLDPGSFSGSLLVGQPFYEKINNLLYFSFITLLTIGYGEIVPLTSIAQKATIFTGLCGQFYVIIITAIVIEKYLQSMRDKNKKNSSHKNVK